MQASGSSEEDIKEAIRSRVYVPCNQMKSAISRKGMPEVGLLDDQSRRKLNAFISSYPKDKIVTYYILKSKKLPKAGSLSEIWGKAQNFGISRKLPKRNVRTKVDDNETKHIEELSQTELKSTESKCVLIDPGRRDIMFCTKETSTVEHRETFIYTKNHHSGRSKHFRILRKSAQSAIVKEAEATISGTESESVNLEKFTRYVKTRATRYISLAPLLSFASMKSVISNMEDFSWFFFPQLDNESDDCSFKHEVYYNYLQIMFRQPHITKRLEDQQKSSYLQKISAVLEDLQLLPFRKLKFSSKLFYDQNDNKLVDSLKGKSGQDAILVFGDGSAPNTKFHEPTRNKGLIATLKKNGFTVYLVNEYKIWKPLRQFLILDLSNERRCQKLLVMYYFDARIPYALTKQKKAMEPRPSCHLKL
ncbi:hypothetical protein BDF21DRAFT_396049 [Thamnidium elegans]|nr:hypothetical protein BDF21DRAFT_396049 [Thamnidium elegans]